MHQSEVSRTLARYDLGVKVALLVVSVATIVLLAVAAYEENFLPAWRKHQIEYKSVLSSKARNEKEKKLADDFVVKLRQLVVRELDAVDRCVSCHLGIEDPRMADQPQPYTTHPGDYLQIHEPSRFGCAACHQGQGRATEVAAAHGRVPHWEKPMIERKFLRSTCGRCHYEADLFGGDRDLYSDTAPVEISHEELARSVPGGRLVSRGKELFRNKGCLGCHAYRGKGGSLGPDLTYVGDKTFRDFDFSRFRAGEPHTVENWLRKHFLEPAEISPGTIMPPLDLTEADADALTAYMLSLKRKTAPRSHRPAPRAVAAQPATGAELYRLMCSSCHGASGRESEVPGLRTPALNSTDFLAVAGDDFLRFTIEKGRTGTKMPSWEGSLSRDSVDRIVRHIRGWEPAGPSLRAITARRGDPASGRAIYQGNCANCHGVDGEGGIGNALGSLTFLALASDEFLARTIVEGRPGTAMPSWRHLGEQQVSDLLAYLRSWHHRSHDVEAVLDRSQRAGAVQIGQATYRAWCASCHGRDGEGGIGVNLAAGDFLARVDRRYLFDAITRGRPGTAMPRWGHLSGDQIAGLIAYLKSWQRRPDERLDETPLPRGDWRLGEVVYGYACQSCHGDSGRGGTGPQIANPEFLRSASDAQLLAWIGQGKAGTAMKGFLPAAQGVVTLTRSQILDVIAFLRYQALTTQTRTVALRAGDPRRGAELYSGSCSSCHGRHGEGASGPQLNNPVFLESASDGFLTGTIVLGRTGTPMRSMVHGREGLGQISPAQVDDVVAYLRTWSQPGSWRLPRPAVDLTPEDINLGRIAYGRYCASCHGPNGKGSGETPPARLAANGEIYFAPALNNPEFLQSATDGFLLATIARGRRGTPMRPFGKGAGGIVEISSEEIVDIVTFLRSWQTHLPHDVAASGASEVAARQESPGDAAGGLRENNPVESRGTRR